MSEERLQEIKDSISLQYKVQEANDLHKFNIFTDEEQELVDEIERLNKDLGDITKLFAIEKEKNRQAIEELENIPINANGGDILESERKVYHILKGSE